MIEACLIKALTDDHIPIHSLQDHHFRRLKSLSVLWNHKSATSDYRPHGYSALLLTYSTGGEAVDFDCRTGRDDLRNRTTRTPAGTNSTPTAATDRAQQFGGSAASETDTGIERHSVLGITYRLVVHGNTHRVGTVHRSSHALFHRVSGAFGGYTESLPDDFRIRLIGRFEGSCE